MKILAVDDDPIILALVEEFVSALGDHTLVTAISAGDALEHIEQSQETPFDCFFFDIQMPGFDGIELTARVRQQEHLRDVPIIMLTALADKNYIDSAFSAGATDYVTKPFDAFDLRGRIALIAKAVATKRLALAGPSLSTQPLAFNEPIALTDPISIFDVDHMIELTAMENYLMQLSRGAIFGSTAFGFSIRDIEGLHDQLCPFEFHSMISDVGEIISDGLADGKFLMTYSGSGVFICVSDRSWTPNTDRLMDAVNLRLSQTEIYNNAGGLLNVRVSVGRPFRFVWKSGQGVLDTIGSAYETAEQASKEFADRRNDIWLVDKIA
jgi:CheY-like chemotaxis protein